MTNICFTMLNDSWFYIMIGMIFGGMYSYHTKLYKTNKYSPKYFLTLLICFLWPFILINLGIHSIAEFFERYKEDKHE